MYAQVVTVLLVSQGGYAPPIYGENCLTTVTREAYAFPSDFSTLARRCLLACSSREEGGMTKAELVDHVAAAMPVLKHQTEAVITGRVQKIQYLQTMLTTVLPAGRLHGGREHSPPFP